MSEITDIQAHAIKDSRGRPTLRVSVIVGDEEAWFDVPSGASTGSSEAHELRDSDGGVGVAIDTIEGEIKDVLVGMDVHEQRRIDQTMIDADGTPHKSQLGGNSIIGVSVACARTAAQLDDVSLYEYLAGLGKQKRERQIPKIFMNLINGGKHAEGGSVVQEHHVVLSSESLQESMEHGKAIQKKLNEYISDREYSIGDEGGVVFNVRDVYESFELLNKAMEGMSDVELGTDVAASSFYTDGAYLVDGETKTKEDMIEMYTRLNTDLGLKHIEDPFEENDFDGFAELLRVLPDINIIGDDLTTTNAQRLQEAIDKKSISSLIIKPNQIGTLTETIDTIELAHAHGINCIVSHRSGETLDPFIADLTRAFYCYGIKSGAWGQKEREVKYERLLKIY